MNKLIDYAVQLKKMFDPLSDNVELYNLGDLGLFFRGKGISNSDLKEEGFPCLTYGMLYTKYDVYIDEVYNYIDEDTANKSIISKKGDILFPTSGETLDEIGKASVNLLDDDLYIGGDTLVFRLKDKQKVNSLYMSYLLNSDIFRIQSRRFGQGHSIVHIYEEHLKDIIVSLPNKKQQDKISSLLYQLDTRIEIYKKYLDVEKNFLSNMINLLTTDNQFIPEKYLEEKINSVSNFYNGYAFDSSSMLEEGKYLIATISNVQNGKLVTSTNDKYLDQLPSNLNVEQLLNKDDLLISMTGNVGRVCLNNKENILLNQRVGKIVPSKLDHYYMYYSLRNDKFLNRMTILAQGGAQPNLSVKDIYNYRIKFPPKKYQKQIGNILKKIDYKNQLIEEKIEVLIEERNTIIKKTIIDNLFI